MPHLQSVTKCPSTSYSRGNRSFVFSLCWSPESGLEHCWVKACARLSSSTQGCQKFSRPSEREGKTITYSLLLSRLFYRSAAVSCLQREPQQQPVIQSVGAACRMLILAAGSVGLPKSPCQHLPVAVRLPNLGSVGANQAVALCGVPVPLSHCGVRPREEVPGGKVPLRARAAGLGAVTCSRRGARAPCARWLPESVCFLQQEKQLLKRSSRMEN